LQIFLACLFLYRFSLIFNLKALAQLPGAHFWAIVFFLMMFFLGLDSQFAQVRTVSLSFKTAEDIRQILKVLSARWIPLKLGSFEISSLKSEAWRFFYKNPPVPPCCASTLKFQRHLVQLLAIWKQIAKFRMNLTSAGSILLDSIFF
jgi:hypothetical protein